MGSKTVLRLKRIARKTSYTIGRLYVNGTYFCDTCENTDRGLDESMPEQAIIRRKITGVTAIPTGLYRIGMDTYSPKFGNRAWARPYNGRIPTVLGVKGFSRILIHVGNCAPRDTDGCILVGKNKVVGQVVDSVRTFYDLMDKHLIPAKNRGDEIWLAVE